MKEKTTRKPRKKRAKTFANIDSKKPKKVPVKKGDLTKEISSSRRLLYSTRSFYSYNPDDLVGRKGLEIYEKMKREDDQVKACLTIKKFARLSTTWAVKPGDGKNKQSIEMAELITHALKNLKGTFERTLLNILTAIEYGYSITEKVFIIYEEGPFKGKIGLKKLASREPFYYRFLQDIYGNVLGLTFDGAPTADGKGTLDNPYPVDKFVIYSYNAEHDNPYGQSDLRPAYRPWIGKDWNIKWWNIFNERFGMPTVHASYPSGKKGLDKQAMNEVDDIMRNLQAKSGFRAPDNIKFELLEATRKGQESYGSAIEKYDTMISRSILVPSLLGFTEQDGGSYALGKKHFDVFLFVLEMLGRDIEETIVGDQIIRPLIKLNYGDIDEELMPIFEFESLVDEDTEARTRVVKMLADANLIDKREEWVREYLMLPERDLKNYPHVTPIGEAPKPPASFPSTPEDPDKKPSRPSPRGGSQPSKGKADEGDAKDDLNDEDMAKFELSRSAGTFEGKVNFAKIDKGLNIIEKSLKEVLQEIVGWWREDVLKKSKRILANNDLQEVEKLKIRYGSDFKINLRDYMVKTHLDSKLGALEEVQEVGYPAEIKRKFGLLLFQDSAIQPWEPLPPREAMNFFNKKVIVKVPKEGGGTKLLALGKMNELSYYDRKAFSITGVEQDYILKETKMQLYNGLKNGNPRETMAGISKIFEKYLDSGELKDGKLVNPSRIETIVRTNTTEALNEGRKAMVFDPEVEDFVPYLMWSSILDGRTSPYCEHMDGKIFRKGEVMAPPAHYNCRSVIVPVTNPEIESAGGVTLSNWTKENAATPRGTGFAKHDIVSDGVNMRFDPLPDGTILLQCPFPTCISQDFIQLKDELGTKTFLCNDCKGKFKVSPVGDIYFWEPGEERWVRQTRRLGGIL